MNARAILDKASEADIQRAIIDYLVLALHPNVPFFAVPNGEYRHIGTARKLKGQGVVPGVADILILYRGRALCIEVKAPGGRQSEPQRVFEAKCCYQGVPYEIATGLDDAVEIVKRHGVPTRGDADVARAA